MSKLRVGVLRGGPSSEYEVSLKTGASVLKNLSRQQFEPKDIFISRDGLWHLGGVPIWPEQAAEQVDIFFNALHGEYGEDGQVQRLLTNLERPFTGPEEISALASINKPLAKSLLAKAGIKVAPTLLWWLEPIIVRQLSRYLISCRHRGWLSRLIVAPRLV